MIAYVRERLSIKRILSTSVPSVEDQATRMSIGWPLGAERRAGGVEEEILVRCHVLSNIPGRLARFPRELRCRRIDPSQLNMPVV